MELTQFKTVEQLAAAIKSLDMVTSVAWTDYFASSTITGWTSYTISELFYKKIGRLMFVVYRIHGTSDDTVATFTLPHASETNAFISFSRVEDNGGGLVAGLASIANSSTVNIYSDLAASAWTNSGTKRVQGQFWYET